MPRNINSEEFRNIFKKKEERVNNYLDVDLDLSKREVLNRINLTGFKEIRMRYTKNRTLCKKNLNIEGKWRLDVQYGPQFETKLKTERAGEIQVLTDEKILLGGDGTAIHPLSLCGAGFCGCFSAAFAKWAAWEGIELNDFKIKANASLDASGVLGIEEGLPMFDNFQLDLYIESEAEIEALEKVLDLTEKRCFCSYCISHSIVPNISLRKESPKSLKDSHKIEYIDKVPNINLINRINLDTFKRTQKEYSQNRSLCKKDLEVEGVWRLDDQYGPQFQTKIKTERAGEILVQTDETLILGGGGTAFHPVAICIAGFCAGFSTAYAKWAAVDGIILKDFNIKAIMNIDLTTGFGIEDNIPMIDSFDVELIVDSDTTLNKLLEILEITKKRCFCYYCYSTPIFPEVFIHKIVSDQLDKKKKKEKKVISPPKLDYLTEIKKKFVNILNKSLHSLFKEYYKETGNYANWGTSIKKDFIKNLDNKIKNDDLTDDQKQIMKKMKEKCLYINKNHEIRNLIIDKIQNTFLTQKEIAKELDKFGLNISNSTISKIAKFFVFNNLNEYKNRFPSFKTIASAIRKGNLKIKE
ncbi:MAG: OsmC family protein [Promethearchaeota archaeon]